MAPIGKCLQWLKKRNTLEKILIIACIVLLFTSSITAIIGITHGKNTDQSSEKSECSSRECFETGGLMLSKMKPDVDPCNDFYEYACGQYVSTQTAFLDQHKSSVKQQSADLVRLSLKHWFEVPSKDNELDVFKKAKIFYRTCMDYGSQEYKNQTIFLEVLKQEMIGNWPILDPLWSETDITLEQHFASLIMLDVPVAFKLDVLKSESSGKYTIKISPGGPFLLHQNPKNLRNDPMLRSYLVNVLILLGVENHRIEMEMNDVLSFESLFFKYKEEAEQRCVPHENAKDIASEYGTITVNLQELHTRIPDFNWTAMFSSFINAASIKELTVELYCSHYIEMYITALKGYSPQLMYNYLGWRFLDTFINHLGPSFKKLHGDYMEHFSKPTLSSPPLARWKECVMLLEKYMLPVTAAAYVQQDISPDILDEAKSVTANLKDSAKLLLSSLPWLEEHERQRSKQKVSELVFEISLMKDEFQSNQLDHLYSNLDLFNDHLAKNIMRIRRFLTMQKFQKLLSLRAQDYEWKGLSLTSPPADSEYDGNSIRMYFDQVRTPFLRMNQPGFLNYGSIGFLLSYELIQNLATLKLDISKSHQKHLWNLIEERTELVQCFATQYSRFKIDSVNVEVNGNKTLKQSLTDNMAIRIAYDAYTREQSKLADEKLPGLDYTKYQNFFLSFAQTFCEVFDIEGGKTYIDSAFAPAKVRVNAVLNNFPKFAESYGCRLNSSPKLIHTCIIW